MNEAIQYFFMAWTDPGLIGLAAVGTFIGIYIGALPGLSVTMAVSILISFTFRWHVNEALVLIAGIYLGGVYGGSRASILLNIPGGPAQIATSLDGYPIAQRGEAGILMGLTTLVSVIGGFISIAVLAVAAPSIAEYALAFGPREYLLLAVWGLLLVGSLSGESLSKGIFAGALGVLISTVGLDPLTSQPRLTFGSLNLSAGISYVAAMIGFFGIAEILTQLHNIHASSIKQKIGRIFPSRKMILKYLPLTIRSSFIGVGVGALPGAGGDIAALMAYDNAKRSTKNPEVPFGKGAYEGVVAPETANNSAVPAAYIPMLTLGIPGDAVTAIIIGALYIHGLNPGPMLMIQTPHLFWFTVGSLTLANLFLLIFGLTGIRIFTKIVEIPKNILLPIILIISVVGAYSINNNLTDVYWMLGFGLLGYFLKVYRYEVGPVVLGMVLGPLIDRTYRQTMITVDNNPIDFFTGFFQSYISLGILAALIITMLMQTKWWSKLFRK